MTVQELNLMRRSVGDFDKTKDVNMTLVKRVIEEAVYAPSAFNLQPWRIIMVRSDEAKSTLHSMAYKQDKVLDAPVTLILIADHEGYKADRKAWDSLRENKGEEAVEKFANNMEQSIGKTELTKARFANSNLGLLAMNLMMLFKSYGMDTHPMSGMNFDEIKEHYDLRDSEEAVMLITVGFRDESKPLITRRKRLGYNQIVTEI